MTRARRPTAPILLLALVVAGGAALWGLLGRGGEPEGAGGPGPAAEAAAGARGRPGDAPPGPRPAGASDPRGALRAAITGTVRDEEGRPIAGARVCALTRSPLLPSADAREARCAASEADGRYRLGDLFPVSHGVHASAPTYIPAAYGRGQGARRRGDVRLQPGMEARDIDLTLRGGGVEIRGVVRDLSGGAVEGAQVQAGHAIATSDADGAFSLWLQPGEAWVRATADGYAEGGDRGLAPGHAFQIFLTPEAVLIGRVVRAGDGAPVEGATVTAEGSGWGWNQASAITDAAGKFRLGGLEPGAYKAQVIGDELYGKADRQVILGLGETSAPIVVTAHPAFAVRGAAVVAGGDACDAGTVTLHDRASDRQRQGPIMPDGEATLRGLLPGTYEVSVGCPGQLSAERYEPVTIVDRSLEGLRWEVTAGQAIRGRVVDSRGAPAEGVSVFARPRVDAADARAHATQGWSGQTEADGAFELAGLLAGAYELHVNAWGGRPRATPKEPVPVTLAADGGDVDGVTITLPPTGELRGKVVDGDGRPVARATISLAGDEWRSGAAADDGTFALTDLRPGSYRATARRGFGEVMRAPGRGDDDLQGERVVIEEGEVATVELVVEAHSGVITGVVQGEDGGPVADAFVESSRESERSGAASGGAARQGRWGSLFGGHDPILTDQEGRFTIPGLAPGKHTILAHRRGGGEAILEHAAPGDDVVLTIAATATLSGVVTLAGGGAPEEFRVSVRDDATGFSRGDAFFRSGGAFSLAEVPAGTYKVTATAAGGTAEVEATMIAGEDLEGLRIELAPKITARGRVVDEDGRPIAGMEVRVHGGSGGVFYFNPSGADKRHITDEDGRFEVAQAPTGTVTLSISPRISEDYEWTRVPMVITPGAAEVELAPITILRKRVAPGEAAGDLGYSLQDAEPGADPMARRFVVALVRPGGPAARAGLQVGDEIVRVDGQDVRGPRSYLFSALTQVPPGTTITLGLARGASVSLTAGERP